MFACASPSKQDRSGTADGEAAAGAQQQAVQGSAQNNLRAAKPLSAAELSLQLESLLGQHTVLAADMMRGRIRSDPDFAQAANAALGKNTEAMGQLVGSLFGDSAKEQFEERWAEHVTSLFNYARGLADHDAAARAKERKELIKYEHEISEFFAGASHGRLKPSDADAAIHHHVDELLRQADRYAAKKYTWADRDYRSAYSHTFGLGKTVAAALVTPSAATALEAPQWRLRSELGRLLGEHVVLVVAAMRAGASDAPDFRPAAQAVDNNTRDLAAAMDTLFGPAAARSFQSLWADHVDELMSYTSAMMKHDTAKRDKALANLRTFEGRLADFLATATHKRVTSPALAKAFLMHDQMLVGEVDAFLAKKYQQAHDTAYVTYQQMYDLARQLSDAFGATVAARLPAGAAQTGGGGMAAVVGQH